MNRILIIAALLIVSVAYGITQPREAFGLWEVRSVMVGDRDVTPVAKWFDLNEDGTVHGGNGGMINISGTWSLVGGKVLFTDDFGLSDPMGGFAYEVAGDEMIWSRVEGDMNVRIKMERVQVYPKGPWDHAEGAWVNMANPSHTLFMGWHTQLVQVTFCNAKNKTNKTTTTTTTTTTTRREKRAAKTRTRKN